jgi:hypothetical protein
VKLTLPEIPVYEVAGVVLAIIGDSFAIALPDAVPSTIGAARPGRTPLLEAGADFRGPAGPARPRPAARRCHPRRNPQSCI